MKETHTIKETTNVKFVTDQQNMIIVLEVVRGKVTIEIAK
jgi:hypothetical protein